MLSDLIDRQLERETSSLHLILSTMIFLLVTGCIQPPSEAVIQSRISEFDVAFKTGDVATLDAMISDHYLHTNPSGNVISRENWLSWNKSRAEELNSGILIVENYQTTELDIRILTPASVSVTGINQSNGTRNGEPFETKVRFSHVWILEGGNWKRAVFHDSYID